ncbi:hypothetical protein RRF57_009278 [Xylaria bambusicola]|uniref:Uncharacterized protein n=1 Tax=Xylaria bambusicola TaxID=326684 RepID=A0AAN7UTD2_9PEZI
MRKYAVNQVPSSEGLEYVYVDAPDSFRPFIQLILHNSDLKFMPAGLGISAALKLKARVSDRSRCDSSNAWM